MYARTHALFACLLSSDDFQRDARRVLLCVCVGGVSWLEFGRGRAMEVSGCVGTTCTPSHAVEMREAIPSFDSVNNFKNRLHFS